MALIHHLLLVASVGLLLAAGGRAASRLTSVALERVVAAAPLAASAAAIQALGLGLVGLGTNPVALFLGACAVWLGARRFIPAAATPLGAGLRDRWMSLSPRYRLIAGVFAGANLAWAAWLLRHPAFNIDSHSYQLPEILAWVRNGAPGSALPILPGFPYEAFPATNEVLLSWGSGIARSFVWLTIWPAILFALLAASGWLGLRSLSVPPLPSGLAVASLCAAPMATSFQLNGPNTDFPALVWLVVAAGLCAACLKGSCPALFLPALLAAALAVGTKTTTAPQIGILVALVVLHFRARLLSLGPRLALATAVALVVGGTWYFRNLVEHGSPLWPFFATPWGDPFPPLLGDPQQFTFFRRPLESLSRFGEPGYVTDTYLGALAVLVGAAVAPLFVRSRLVVGAGAVTAVSAFLWTFAPCTGAPFSRSDPAACFHGSPRLLMPGVAVATLALALAARDAGHRGARIWTALLAVALGLNVWQLFALPFPATPRPSTPLAGALVVGALAFASARLPRRRVSLPIALAVGSVAVAGALSVAASNMVQRHARVGLDPRSPYLDAPLVSLFSDVPAADGRPIYTAPTVIPMLAGNDLARKVEAIPRREDCAAIENRARAGWIVVVKATGDQLLGPSTIRACVRPWSPFYEDESVEVYNARSLEVRGDG